MQRRFVITAICLVGMLSLATVSLAQEESRTLEDRLAELETRMEKARVDNNIPGIALAVVKDDKVIFSKGFGVTDIESNEPVTPETIFAIGSTTKSFTASLIAMLADEGKLSFDDPITKFIPELKLKVDTGDEQLTFRDLLSHQSGYSRMSILWAAGTATRPEVIEMSSNAEPYAGFREKFLYNNVTYMFAGFGAGRAVDSDWDTLIAERIFKPLGMNSSNTSISVAQQDKRLSKGYRWNPDTEEYLLLPMRSLDTIGPAGAINSNIVDMAQWVRLHLGRGEVDGKRLISEENHAQLWEQQVEMAPQLGYGMGFMIKKWDGKKVVEHGGNIDGFGAAFALLPEENIGFVLLTNVTASPLQAGSIDIVFSSLLGETKTGNEANVALDVDALMGEYSANFGPFRDATFTVLEKNGNLAIDIPGQQTFELKRPDEDGKWEFALTDQIAVEFIMDENDAPISVVLHQAGMEFECFRKDAEIPILVPLEQLQPYLGKYRDVEEDSVIETVIKHNRLMVIAPDIGMFGLLPPDDDGKWAFRFRPSELSLRFNRDEQGKVVSITRFTPSGETEMPRVEEEEKDVLPTAQQLIAMMKQGTLDDEQSDPGNWKLTGTVSFVHQGASGDASLLLSGYDRLATELDLGKLGFIRAACDGERGWSDSTFGTFEELTGTRRDLVKLSHPLWLLTDWQSKYDSVAVLGESKIDDTRVFELRLSDADLPGRTLFVEADTGLVLKEETAIIAPGIGQFPVTIEYGDYRSVGGFKVAFRTVTEQAQSGKTVVQYEEALKVESLADDAFRLTPRDEKD